MKQVYTSASIIDAQIVHDHLQAAGFEVTITGQVLAGAVGELPANVSPIVQVIDNGQYLPARALVEELTQDLLNSIEGENWQCPRCKETLEANFGQCWNCGYEKGSNDI